MTGLEYEQIRWVFIFFILCAHVFIQNLCTNERKWAEYDKDQLDFLNSLRVKKASLTAIIFFVFWHIARFLY